LYDKLERTVLPLFYANRTQFIDVMRYAIALNGSFFTAQRMLQEYVVKAYNREPFHQQSTATRNPAPSSHVHPAGVAH
jgi:starch phosphorylase